MNKGFLKINWADSLTAGAATAGLLLTELVISKYATYMYDEIILSFLSVIVFGGISVGNLLGLWPKISRFKPVDFLLATAFLTAVSVMGLGRHAALQPLWLGAPFVGYGIFLSVLVGSISMESLVIGFGIGGVALYVLLGLAFNSVAPFLALIAIILPLLAALVHSFSRKTVAVGMAIGIFAGLLSFFGFFAPAFLKSDSLEGLRGAQTVTAPLYTPLIRTDLLKTTDDKFVIVTNGRRFAVVDPQDALSKRLAPDAAFIPSYEIPYLYSRPKNVLVIGPAEGNNVVAALKFKAQNVTAVDINPAVFTIMKGRLSKISEGIYLRPEVKTVTAEGRHYLETTNEKFDLITLQGVQTGTPGSLINANLLESYLLTKEALLTLWNHLTPDGMIWIDEYSLRLRDGPARQTLVSAVAAIAQRFLPFYNFKLQHQIFLYLQIKKNPRGKNRTWREGLILSKKPLASSVREIIKPLPEDVYTERFVKFSEISNEGKDSHPYYIRYSTPIRFIFDIGFILTAVLLALGFIFINKKSRATRDDHINMALFFIGAGFILMVIAVSGPITLLLGDPQLATPVLFLTTYAFGLLGGLIALRGKPSLTSRSLAALVFYLFALPFIFTFLKPTLLGLNSLTFRAFVIVALLAPLAVLAELPYIGILAKFKGARRSKAFAIENLGTFVGAPIGIWLQIFFGFNGAMGGAIVAYALGAIAAARAGKNRNLASPTAIATIALIGGLSAAFVLRTRLFSKFESMSNSQEFTQECRREPVKNEMQISYRNATRLSQLGKITVVVGKGDGCYKQGTDVHISKIKRHEVDRAIYIEKEVGFAHIENIRTQTFRELAKGRKAYLVKKFGPDAHLGVYDLITIVDSKAKNPTAF